MKTWTTFIVPEPAEGVRERLVDALNRIGMSSVDVSIGRTSAIGFTRAADPIDPTHDMDSTWPDPSVATFAFRVDTIKVQASTLRLYVRRRVTENLKATRRERMPSSERMEIAESVRDELMRRTPPKIVAHPVEWDLTTNRMRIATGSAATVDLFVSAVRMFLDVEPTSMDLPGLIDASFTPAERSALYHVLPGFGSIDVPEGVETALDLSRADKVRRTAFLGREFLTWLAFRSSVDNRIDVDQNPVETYFRKAVATEGDTARDASNIRAMDPLDVPAFRSQLASGQTIRKAAIEILTRGTEFQATIDASLHLSSVRLPDFAGSLDEEPRFAADMRAELENAVHGMFVEFLRMRMSSTWTEEAETMRGWFQTT